MLDASSVRFPKPSDSQGLGGIFYRTAAVAKLGLPPPLYAFQLACPALASRLAKKTVITCAIEPTVRDRQVSETRCSRSPLLDTYPNSTSTEGTSGAFNTLKPADF